MSGSKRREKSCGECRDDECHGVTRRMSGSKRREKSCGECRDDECHGVTRRMRAIPQNVPHESSQRMEE